MTHTTPEAAQIHAAFDDFEPLVLAYYPIIRRLAFAILGDHFDADDAAQETFIAAYRNMSRYRGEATIKTWLSSITVNICRGKLRKRKVIQSLKSTLQALIPGAPAPSPEHAALQNEADQHIWRAVDGLDEKHRLVVIMHYVHEMSAPEIGFALGISEGTVYSRLHYARRKLQIELDPPIVEACDGSS